jgi:preprotein translocase subunit SecG
MIETLLLLAHLVLAGLIITLVLLQRGKGAEAGTGFGAGASGTVFGARGSANFFSRATAVLATLFFATSLTLAWLTSHNQASNSALEGSVIQGTAPDDTEGPGLLPPADEAGAPAADDLAPPPDETPDQAPAVTPEEGSEVPFVTEEAPAPGDGVKE